MSSDIDIVPVVAADIDAFDRAFGLLADQHRAEREFPTVSTPGEARVRFTRPNREVRLEMLQAISHERPTELLQWNTLVHPDHRGHRLGLAMKVANLDALQQEYPQAVLAHTWNAKVNAPMLAVNTTMGFRPVEYLGEWQRFL